MVMSAIVQNSIRTMNISNAVRNKIITAATTQTKPTRMVSRFFWLALSQKILKKFRALVTIWLDCTSMLESGLPFTYSVIMSCAPPAV